MDIKQDRVVSRAVIKESSQIRSTPKCFLLSGNTRRFQQSDQLTSSRKAGELLGAECWMHSWHPGNVTEGAKPLCQRVLRGQPRPELTMRGGPGAGQCRAPVLRRNVPEAQRQLPIRRRVLLEQQVPAPPKKEGGRQRGKEELSLLGEAGPLPPLSWEPAAEPLQTSEPSRSGAARSRAWGNRSVPLRPALPAM